MYSYIFICLMLAFHKSWNMQQAINRYNVFVTDHPVQLFDVQIIKHDVMYKDISLRTLDITYSFSSLI